MKLDWKLTPKLTFIFVLFAVALLLTVGVLAYRSGQQALVEATVSELTATAVEKEAALDEWIEDRQWDLGVLAALPTLHQALLELRTAPGSLEMLRQEMSPWLGPHGFRALLVLDPETGQVLAATDPSEEGKFKENRPYFVHGLDGPYVQNPYYSMALRGPAMTIAVPVRSEAGQVLGVLVGRLNLESLNEIIQRSSGIHETADTFLVNKSNLIVTRPRFISDAIVLQQGLRTAVIDRCLAGHSGASIENDYRGVPAVIVYRWLPDHGLCLKTKIDEAEALAAPHAFGSTLFLLGVFVLLAASAIAILLAHSITHPVRALQAGVSNFGQGQLDVRLPEKRGDELGLLAREFNQMAATIAEKEEQLQAHAHNLENLVAERTAALQASEAELRAIFSAMPDVILVLDGNGRYLKVAPTNTNLLYRPPDDLVGKTLSEVFPLAEANFFLEQVRQSLETGRDIRIEYSLAIEAAEKWFSATVAPMQADTVVWVARDITERKQTEQAIAQALESERQARAAAEASQNRLAFLAEASETLALSLDYKVTLERVARLAVPEIADWCAVDIVAADGTINRLALIHSDPARVKLVQELQQRLRPETDTSAERVMRTGEPEVNWEIPDSLLEATIEDKEILSRLRQLRLTSSMVVPLSGRERALGAITLAAESGRRFGEQDLQLAQELARRAVLSIENARLYRDAQRLNKELEQRVRRRTAQLEAANKELEAFAYSVSHDLRAPLRAMDGFSRILMEDYTSDIADEAVHYLKRVRENAQKMGQLIDDLLAFSRLNREQLQTQLTSPGLLVQQVLTDLQDAADERYVEVEVGDLPDCRADPHLLKQVWINLLSNAFKYSRQRDGARIEIGAVRENGTAVYYVKDNGVGFDMHYADKLFGVFQRLHRAEEYEGTGVGLAIVQRIIHRHGGRVWAEAEPGQGATFFFTLGENTVE